MAQTLLAAGYSPDTLKVLLGGLNSWQAAGYPTDTSGLPAGAQPVPGAPGQIIIGTPALEPATAAPAP